jgi:hypothetical protein
MPSVRDDVIHKEDLDQFKLELLQKINSRFLEEDDKEKSLASSNVQDEIITPEKFEDDTISMVSHAASIKDPMELMAGDYLENKRQRKLKRKRLNSGSLNTDDSETQELDLDKCFVLERTRGSTQSKGYFFLACVFGLMCGSSYTNNQAVQIGEMENKSQILSMQTNSPSAGASSGKFCVGRELKSQELDLEMESKFGSMNLVSSDVSDEFISDLQLKEMYKKQQNSSLNTAKIMKNLGQYQNSPMYGGIFQNLLSGKYTYLTYMMASSACFFFWMMPNHHKVRLIKPRSYRK